VHRRGFCGQFLFSWQPPICLILIGRCGCDLELGFGRPLSLILAGGRDPSSKVRTPSQSTWGCLSWGLYIRQANCAGFHRGVYRCSSLSWRPWRSGAPGYLCEGAPRAALPGDRPDAQNCRRVRRHSVRATLARPRRRGLIHKGIASSRLFTGPSSGDPVIVVTSIETSEVHKKREASAEGYRPRGRSAAGLGGLRLPRPQRRQPRLRRGWSTSQCYRFVARPT
jgi:hypothetical protein